MARLSRLLGVVAFAAMAFGVAPSSWAQEAEAVSSLLAGAQISSTAGGTIITPASSIARAGDAGRFAHTHYHIFQPADRTSPAFAAADANPNIGPPFPGYFAETPASLACIYGLTAFVAGCNTETLMAHAVGGSKLVVVTIAYHYPTALADLQHYSVQFGLPAPLLTIHTIGSPAVNSGWNQEAALDMDMIHAMAPSARILLVEGTTNSNANLLAAVDYGRTQVLAFGGGEVNGSWGENEFSTEASFDTHFVGNKVVYFFSTGDAINTSWPAVSSKVVAVGGTSTSRSPANHLFLGSEASWADAGVGPSIYIGRPAFQNVISAKVGAKRGIPDISADANPSTGVWVYWNGGWYIIGGTSVSSPMMAGMTNRAGHFLASSVAQNTFMYSHIGDTTRYHDVGRGYCGNWAGFTLTVGAGAAAWDFCTGLGSPKGATGL